MNSTFDPINIVDIDENQVFVTYSQFNDPFKITNALLILLEDSIDELHILKPFNDK